MIKNGYSNKTVLIFDLSIDGHHLEYIHHLYIEALKKREINFHFVVNSNFTKVNHLFEWPKAENINIYFFQNTDLPETNNAFLKCYYKNKLLKKFVKKTNADKLILISLMEFMPLLPLFFINSKVKISGIIYLIYLYRYKFSILFQKISDISKYLMFSFFSSFEKLYILNDEVSPRILNKKFHTSKFIFLPDPYIPLDNHVQLEPVREQYGIKTPFIYLHFGALEDRKGTIEILDAIHRTPSEKIEKITFVFLGKIGKSIKKDFMELLNKIESQKKNVIVKDQFCSYNLILSFCNESTIVLMPYKDQNQSSGVLNYASLFGIPVLAINNGLICKIVKRYRLGYLIDACKPNLLADFFNHISPEEIIKNSSKQNVKLFLNNHTIEKFSKTIL
ncbi:hypothetical protein GCM10010992_26960 [Cloacibacterium rupense]|uniref:Glycosyl transferase family 1 domain-containing protein n=1 Tax=Cloacibacterium rupense TaxID=517423 RepID=A0ABQ2NNH8_9FLAO|nr:glycosyltransferase [Cloacibacterium rupense]GGP06542.1 hypothetical protein GCM10010992_26960 [Cloacibacterium rupense]